MSIKHLLFPLLMAGSITASQAQKLRPTNPQPSLAFVENKGQVTDQYGNSRTDINYRVGGSGLSMFVGSGQLNYQWAAPAAQLNADKQQISMYRMDVTLIGADPQAKAVAEQKQSFFERYYTPQFGEQGATAHAYQKITYTNVYPNIDWVLHVNDKTVEYDFVVRPGGKVSDIKLQYGGATHLNIDKAGQLTATTPMGSITEAAPISYQEGGKSIASSFTLNGNILGFNTDNYSGTLVIDPTLSWATYFGGALDDKSNPGCVTSDTSGNIFLTGYSNSTSNIATTGAYQTVLGGSNDAFVAKFNKYGSLLWSSYYGGTGQDYATGVTCDHSKNVFICGYTNSTSAISTTGSYQATFAGGTDGFLVKFDSSGARQWATYIGGSSTEQALGLASDITGNIYITGYTVSTAGIASAGSYQTTFGGGQDAFLFKFSNAGTRIWSTYFGGSSTDNGLAVKCDHAWHVCLSGFAKSTSAIASTGAYQSSLSGGEDIFVAQFDSAGVRQWSTYYGGTANERCYSVDFDMANNLYLAGYSLSTSAIATTGSYQTAQAGGDDCFLAKFSSTGSLSWATYYGGSGNDDAYGVQSDGAKNVYLLGSTTSASGIASVGAFKDTISGFRDGLLVKFDTSGTRLWATYIGGDDNDICNSFYCTPMSEIYIGGSTASTSGLTTTGSYQPAFGGNSYDAFLIKLNVCELTAPTSISGNDTVCRNATYTYTVPSVSGATSYTWTLPIGWTGSSSTNTIGVTAGITSDTIKVAANFLCGTSAAVVKPVYVSPLPTIVPGGTIKVCSGDSATFTANTGTAYQWLQAGTVISGATNATYTAHTANTYAVIVTNTHGCADTSLVDTVIVNPLPVPVITATGSVLSTGIYATYQWSRNGTVITGAISSTYTIVVMSGDYTVTVTDSNGCSGTSVIYSPTTGIHEVAAGKFVSIYPNPSTDWLYIEATDPVMTSISTIDGKLLIDRESAQKINVSNCSEGLYLLRIYDKKTGALLFTEKMVKAANNGW